MGGEDDPGDPVVGRQREAGLFTFPPLIGRPENKIDLVLGQKAVCVGKDPMKEKPP